MPGRRDERYESDVMIELEQGTGVIRNISASGLYFVTDVSLKRGERVNFTLELSGSEIGRITARCEARVVRTERRGKLRGFGATFEKIDFQRITPH
jgi:PilZ domain